MLIVGFIYSVSISWNINGISHNFIHNPYFRSPLLNRVFSILESTTVGFNQVFYECYAGYHAEHHFRAKVHWTRMRAFRDQILEQQRAAGVRMIRSPHAVGFLDPDFRAARGLGSRPVQGESESDATETTTKSLEPRHSSYRSSCKPGCERAARL